MYAESERSRNNAVGDEGASEPMTQEVIHRMVGVSHVKLWFQNQGESLKAPTKPVMLRTAGG